MGSLGKGQGVMVSEAVRGLRGRIKEGDGEG